MDMKMIGRLAAFGMLLWPAGAMAELRVTLEMEHRKFVRFEPITAFVTIANESDTYFVAKGDRENPLARLVFTIESGTDESAERINAAPILKGVTVKPGAQQRIMVSLSDWYALGGMGGYSITAQVEWKGRQYSSGTYRCSVENGIPLTSITRDVAGRPGVVRKYSLRYLSRKKTERLFLCVEEVDKDGKETGYNCGTFDLGPLIRVDLPQIQMDADGNILVVHQMTPNCYLRSTFKVTKERVTPLDRTYHLADGSKYPRPPVTSDAP